MVTLVSLADLVVLDFGGSCCHCMEGGKSFFRLGYQVFLSGVGWGESPVCEDERDKLG